MEDRREPRERYTCYFEEVLFMMLLANMEESCGSKYSSRHSLISYRILYLEQ